jgi:hypothetical protein
MSVKFSVGVSETEEDDEDRELLETLRRSPSRIDRTSDEGLETRPAGWPLRAEGEDDPEPQPSIWAW